MSWILYVACCCGFVAAGLRWGPGLGLDRGEVLVLLGYLWGALSFSKVTPWGAFLSATLFALLWVLAGRLAEERRTKARRMQ